MTVARIRVNGTVTTPSKTGSFFILWEKFDLNNGMEAKRRWTVWQPVPITWTEGTWVDVEGDFGESIQREDDGKPKTFLDRNGHSLTQRDLVINNAVILAEKISQPAPDNVDMDDVRKYGTPLQQTILDDNPF
jgi:hypothetical protein